MLPVDKYFLKNEECSLYDQGQVYADHMSNTLINKMHLPYGTRHRPLHQLTIFAHTIKLCPGCQTNRALLSSSVLFDTVTLYQQPQPEYRFGQCNFGRMSGVKIWNLKSWALRRRENWSRCLINRPLLVLN